MKNRCPCKGCLPPRRSPACHSTCIQYAGWKERREMEKAHIKEAKNIDEMCNYLSRHITSGDFERSRYEHSN